MDGEGRDRPAHFLVASAAYGQTDRQTGGSRYRLVPPTAAGHDTNNSCVSRPDHSEEHVAAPVAG